jgi:hypothetical protein
MNYDVPSKRAWLFRFGVGPSVTGREATPEEIEEAKRILAAAA